MNTGSVNAGQDVGFAAAVYATRKAIDLKESTVQTLLEALPTAGVAAVAPSNPAHLGQQIDVTA